MNIRRLKRLFPNFLPFLLLLFIPSPLVANDNAIHKETKKLLVFGDSMTGWLAERLNAYGKKNGFDVATIVWDGATVSKYANSSRLASLIKEQNPDAVVVCLGMNEMLGNNFEKRIGGNVDKILHAVGDRHLLWVGPPVWPGKGDGKGFNNYMTNKLGVGRYFNSQHLSLPRQSARNPHPSRAGINLWVDKIMGWDSSSGTLHLPGHLAPNASETSKSKIYIYKKMKESF